MVLRREVTKIDPASIGLQESDSMENVGLYYYFYLFVYLFIY